MFSLTVLVLVVYFILRHYRKRPRMVICSNCSWNGPEAIWKTNMGCPECHCTTQAKASGMVICSNCRWHGPKAIWKANMGCPECHCTIQAKAPSLFSKPGFPTWFNVLNILALAPIILYPGVLLATAMLSDSAKDLTMVYILFVLALVYPLILLLMRRLSYSLYNRNKIISIAIPLIPAGLFLYLLVFLIVDYVEVLTHLHARG